jgi:hypothetical protein
LRDFCPAVAAAAAGTRRVLARRSCSLRAGVLPSFPREGEAPGGRQGGQTAMEQCLEVLYCSVYRPRAS